VVEMQHLKKEMHSHKLSAMADNYPADWCINPRFCHAKHWPSSCKRTKPKTKGCGRLLGAYLNNAARGKEHIKNM